MSGGFVPPARPEEREALIALQRQASLMWEEDRDSLFAEPDAWGQPTGRNRVARPL